MTEGEPDPEVHLARRNRARWIVAPVAAVVLGLLVVFALSEPQRNRPGRNDLRGQVVPALAGDTLAGDFFDIDDQRGRWVVVNFFASWCPPCRREHPQLTEFVARHADGDAVVVGVAMADRRADVQAFVDDLGGGWPLIPEDTTRHVIDFAVTAPPTTYLVAPSGVIAEQYIGEVTADQLDEAIDFFTSAPTEDASE